MSTSYVHAASPEEFQAASNWITSEPAAANLSTEVKLEVGRLTSIRPGLMTCIQLYGLFKYITTSAGP